MQNLILSLEGQFPQIYSQSKLLNGGNSGNLINLNNPQNLTSSHSSLSSSASSLSATSTANSVAITTTTITSSDEILPNKLPLKRRLSEFRFGRDGGTLTVGKKGSSSGGSGIGSNVSTFTTNPFAFDKFKDITTAFTVQLHEDGVVLDPGSIGPFPYSHPLILQLLNAINNATLPLELFIGLFEQSLALPPQQQLFYDGCVVVGVVEWREGMTLTIGNVGTSGTRQHMNVQWTRRINNSNPQSAPLNGQTPSTPESHKVLLKPTPDCWEYALAFMATLPDGAKYARIMEDDDKLIEFERQFILINEPIVCLDPSPMVMYAMNALYFDHFKNRLFEPLLRDAEASVYDELDQTLLNLAVLKPNRSDRTDSSTSSILPSNGPTSPTSNPRYRKIGLIESYQERERRRTTEPIYGIDHRRQFVKNRQALPPSSFIPANWRPFKTIRYEREISGGTSHLGSLSKLYYCVNVFYAPPPTYPPIQLLLQVGTSPDSSTSGFLHHLHFQNLIETENYLQNLRNLLLIENGNCNLKVITDISTTSAAGVGANNANTTATTASASAAGIRKPPSGATATSNGMQSTSPQMQSQPPGQTQAQNQTQPQAQMQQQTQYQLTPHQILQLNQKHSNPNIPASTAATITVSRPGSQLDMSLLAALDALEDYLNEYQRLHNSFNKAYLLLTRFKLNYGQDGIELLLHEMMSGSDNEVVGVGAGVGVGVGDIDADDCSEAGKTDTSVRHRKFTPKTTEPDTNPRSPPILTKQDHINSLKTTFHSLLHTKIMPLAKLKLKLANDLCLIADECK